MFLKEQLKAGMFLKEQLKAGMFLKEQLNYRAISSVG